jgi:hypothetical protein
MFSIKRIREVWRGSYCNGGNKGEGWRHVFYGGNKIIREVWRGSYCNGGNKGKVGGRCFMEGIKL